MARLILQLPILFQLLNSPNASRHFLPSSQYNDTSRWPILLNVSGAMDFEVNRTYKSSCVHEETSANGGRQEVGELCVRWSKGTTPLFTSDGLPLSLFPSLPSLSMENQKKWEKASCNARVAAVLEKEAVRTSCSWARYKACGPYV